MVQPFEEPLVHHDLYSFHVDKICGSKFAVKQSHQEIDSTAAWTHEVTSRHGDPTNTTARRGARASHHRDRRRRRAAQESDAEARRHPDVADYRGPALVHDSRGGDHVHALADDAVLLE